MRRRTLLHWTLAFLLLAAGELSGQARYELPDYLSAKLGAEDRELFTRLLNINIESGWSYMGSRR